LKILLIQQTLNKPFQTLFIPHGALQKQVDIHWNSQRPIDILFPGTYVEPQRVQKKIIMTLGKYADLYDKIISASLYETFQPLDEILVNVFKEEHVNMYEISMTMFYQLILCIDKYVRNVRRKMIIEQLSHLDARVEVYGNGWSKLQMILRELTFIPL
jgi:hypothetical protein